MADRCGQCGDDVEDHDPETGYCTFPGCQCRAFVGWVAEEELEDTDELEELNFDDH